MNEKIKMAYKARDLTALDALAKPTFRELNKKRDFHTPLMLSANRIKHLEKIESLECDAVILNLEDGVAPEEKPFALVLSAIFLSKLKRCEKKLIVRVNALDEGGYEEIVYLNQFMPDAIRVPKIRNRKEVESILHLLNEEIELHLSIETADSWHNLATLAVNKRVTTFYLGILDLFADMRIPQTLVDLKNPTMLYMLSHFLITSRSMGVKPVSFVFQEYQDIDTFVKWLQLEQSMGYDAKGCISPTQVSFARKIFVCSEEEIKRAKVIVKLFEIYQEEGITGFVDDRYGFIDEPVYKGALQLLRETSKNQ